MSKHRLVIELMGILQTSLQRRKAERGSPSFFFFFGNHHRGPELRQGNHRRACAVVSEPVCLLSDCCHTHIKVSINPPSQPFSFLAGLYALNAHVLIADGHVRSQVEPLKMWPEGKGHPLMSKSFFPPFVGGEAARKCAH